MAYVVSRPNGRWEVRETVRTDQGPRPRSLATFTVFDDGVVTRAQAAAVTPVDPHRLLQAVRRAGAPVAPSRADTAARTLLRELTHGRPPSPGLARLLRDRLAGEAIDVDLHAGDGLGDWIDAPMAERGDALRDLLELTDRLPPARRGSLGFPGWHAVAPDG